MVETKRIIGKWIAGGALSVLAIWAVTAICQPNIVPERWDEALQRNLPLSGWKYRYRNESWAVTEYGAHGFHRHSDLSSTDTPPILIWGDSFVEALQVQNSDKMDAVLESLLSTDGNLTPVGAVGNEKWGIGDYYFHIQKYEKLTGSSRCHFIHLFTLEDLYPDRNPAWRASLFLSSPSFHFVYRDSLGDENPRHRENKPLAEIIFAMHPQFFLKMKTRALEIAHGEGLRFRPNPPSSLSVPTETGPGGSRSGIPTDGELHPDWVKGEAPIPAWRFAVDQLKKVATAPVVFIYAPAVPKFDKEQVALDNPEAALVDRFRDLCREMGVGFIDLETEFRRAWLEEGRFVRGFHSSRPGAGHYNATGHEIVAEAIHRWLKEHPHVVHPN